MDAGAKVFYVSVQQMAKNTEEVDMAMSNIDKIVADASAEKQQIISSNDKFSDFEFDDADLEESPPVETNTNSRKMKPL